jgi:hypothetical protein
VGSYTIGASKRTPPSMRSDPRPVTMAKHLGDLVVICKPPDQEKI